MLTGYELHAYDLETYARESNEDFMRRFFCVAHMGALLAGAGSGGSGSASAAAHHYLMSDGSVQFDVGYSASADQQLVSMQQARQMLTDAGFSLSA